MTDNKLLAGLILAAKAEREAGFAGWVQPPSNFESQLDSLVSEGLAERQDDPAEGTYYRPTAEGERVCNLTIHRTQ